MESNPTHPQSKLTVVRSVLFFALVPYLRYQEAKLTPDAGACWLVQIGVSLFYREGFKWASGVNVRQRAG